MGWEWLFPTEGSTQRDIDSCQDIENHILAIQTKCHSNDYTQRGSSISYWE